MTTTHTAHVSDPIAHALASLDLAAEWGEGVRAAEGSADRLASTNRAGSIEARAISRAARDEQRLALKRAEVLAAVAQAQALDSIAESLSRIGLAL